MVKKTKRGAAGGLGPPFFVRGLVVPALAVLVLSAVFASGSRAADKGPDPSAEQAAAEASAPGAAGTGAESGREGLSSPASAKTPGHGPKTDGSKKGSGAKKAVRPQKAAKAAKARRTPIVITADTMKADRTSKTVVFKGDVEAREDFLLCSDELRMEYEGANDVSRIDARGNVRIYRASGAARAERAVFDRRAHTLLLTGNAVIERCTDTVHGDRITLYLEDDSALVEGLRGGRVKARIIPESHCAQGGADKKGADGASSAGIIDVKNTHCYGSR